MSGKTIIIGDSHVGVAADIDQYIPIYIGAVTAYNIASHDDKVQEKLKNYPDLNLIFCAGSVDVIYHVYKNAIIKNITTEIITQEIMNRYVSYLCKLQMNKKSKVYAMCLEPAGDIEDPVFKSMPYSWNKLNEMTLCFNKFLGVTCTNNNIGFIDIYDQMIDPTGHRRSNWVYDGFHMDNHVGLAVWEKYFK
jgi:hypothetical protein